MGAVLCVFSLAFARAGARPSRAARGPELEAAALGPDFSFSGERFLAKVVEVGEGGALRVAFRRRGELVQWPAQLERPLPGPARERGELERKIGGALVFLACGPFDARGRIIARLYLRAGPTLARAGEDVNLWYFGLAPGGRAPFGP